jgi:hypothetical protein
LIHRPVAGAEPIEEPQEIELWSFNGSDHAGEPGTPLPHLITTHDATTPYEFVPDASGPEYHLVQGDETRRWSSVDERLSVVEAKTQETYELVSDERDRGPERLLALLTDPGIVGRVAERLYPAVRRRLRGELLIDRERRGVLADLR